MVRSYLRRLAARLWSLLPSDPLACRDAVECRGEVRLAMYDTGDLDALDPDWRERDEAEKLALAEEVEPVDTSVQKNTTCVGLHEWIVDSLNGATVHPPTPEEVALGRSSTTPSSSDTSLNDPVDRVDVTQFADEGDQIRFTSFVGEGEANVDTSAGETLSEAGVYSGDDRLLNHVLFQTDYEKDDTKTLTVEIVLAFSAA